MRAWMSLSVVGRSRSLGSMSVVGISETKWFGQDIYDVDGFLTLHSGCPVPGAGEKVERNEGDGIVLDPDMVRLWKNSSEKWNPVQCSPQAIFNGPLPLPIVSITAVTP